MAACSVPVSSPLQQIGAPSAGAEKHAARQSAGTCAARFPGSSWIGRSVGAVSSKSGGLERWARVEAARRRGGVRAQAGEGSLQPSERWGDGVSLGTALLPPDVDLGRLESLLFQCPFFWHIPSVGSALPSPQFAIRFLPYAVAADSAESPNSWGNSLTANANLPLPTSLKVDKVKGGVRLGYIRINEGAIEDLVHIDVIVNAAQGDQKAYFQATRNGQFKDKVPPGEPLIMQSLLQALRKSIQIARE